MPHLDNNSTSLLPLFFGIIQLKMYEVSNMIFISINPCGIEGEKWILNLPVVLNPITRDSTQTVRWFATMT